MVRWAGLNRLQNSRTWESPVSLEPTRQPIIASQLETFLITNSEDNAVNGAEHDRAFPRSRMNSMCPLASEH